MALPDEAERSMFHCFRDNAAEWFFSAEWNTFGASASKPCPDGTAALRRMKDCIVGIHVVKVGCSKLCLGAKPWGLQQLGCLDDPMEGSAETVCLYDSLASTAALRRLMMLSCGSCLAAGRFKSISTRSEALTCREQQPAGCQLCEGKELRVCSAWQ